MARPGTGYLLLLLGALEVGPRTHAGRQDRPAGLRVCVAAVLSEPEPEESPRQQPRKAERERASSRSSNSNLLSTAQKWGSPREVCD